MVENESCYIFQLTYKVVEFIKGETEMNYEEKYKEALEWMRSIYPTMQGADKEDAEHHFPELCELEDERIRKAIICGMNALKEQHKETFATIPINDCIAWLEKQDEKKHIKKQDYSGLNDFERAIHRGFLCAGMENVPVTIIKETAKDCINEIKSLEIGCKQKPVEQDTETHDLWVYIREWNDKFGRLPVDEDELAACIDYVMKRQKPADKVKPKFKVGDWVQIDGGHVMKILDVRKYVLCYKILNWCGNESVRKISDIDSIAHLWTIQDAKVGDVLYFSDETIVIFKDLYNATTFHSYCHIEDGLFAVSKDDMPDWWEGKGFQPATKEQRDLLFQKMKEAGYEWDAEKKELRKIEQKPTQEIKPFEAEHGKYYYCIKDYFCGGKKQASKGDVVQALRGLPIMGLKDASEYFLPVNNIQNHAWSEEDEEKRKLLISILEVNHPNGCFKVNPINTSNMEVMSTKELVNWLKSLKPNHWKPSEEQMKALNAINIFGELSYVGQGGTLVKLYNDLKKL